MGVRVRVALSGRHGRRLVAVAMLTGGFETREPAVLLPGSAARQVLSVPLSKAQQRQFEVAGGKAEFLVASEALFAQVVAPGRPRPRVRLTVVVAPREREVLLSDTAIDALGVKIESMGLGLWRFAGERRVRPSDPIELW